MSNTLPICIVCLNTSLEYIDLETPFDAGQNEEDVKVIELSAEKVLTYLDCFRVCTRLEPLGNALNVLQSLCAACGLDLKVAYNFLRRAERADKLLREAAQKSKLDINAEVIDVEDVEEDCSYEIRNSEEEREKQVLFYENDVVENSETCKLGGEEITYGCLYCEENFFSTVSLNFHMMQIHPSLASLKELDGDEELELLDLEEVELVDKISTNASERDESEQYELTQDSYLVAKTEEDMEVSQYVSGLTCTSDTTPATVFNCASCTRSFDNHRALKQHHWRVHKRPKGITCRICQQTIKDNETMREHLEGAHSDTVQCGKCDYKCKELKLVDHEHTVHAEQQDFFCNICSKTFTSSSMLNAHMKYHQRKEANVKSDACSICGKQFSTQYYLMQHMVVHREERNVYKCPQCEKVYMTKTALDTHLRMHSGDTKQCPECGKRFARPYELKVHLRFHNRTYPFTCEVCGKCFAIKGHLRTHMWRHQGLKLQCEECGKLFTSTKALHEHSFSHTAMPFPCTYCVKGYPSKQKYKMHLKTVHMVDLDENELQKMSRNAVPKQPLKRKKLTLVQADSVMKEVIVKSKVADEGDEEIEDLSVVLS